MKKKIVFIDVIVIIILGVITGLLSYSLGLDITNWQYWIIFAPIDIIIIFIYAIFLRDKFCK